MDLEKIKKQMKINIFSCSSNLLILCSYVTTFNKCKRFDMMNVKLCVSKYLSRQLHTNSLCLYEKKKNKCQCVDSENHKTMEEISITFKWILFKYKK